MFGGKCIVVAIARDDAYAGGYGSGSGSQSQGRLSQKRTSTTPNDEAHNNALCHDDCITLMNSCIGFNAWSCEILSLTREDGVDGDGLPLYSCCMRLNLWDSRFVEVSATSEMHRRRQTQTPHHQCNDGDEENVIGDAKKRAVTAARKCALARIVIVLWRGRCIRCEIQEGEERESASSFPLAWNVHRNQLCL
jgi:hypothetical protein